jgi:predicted house-cleaning noncanonical NTP pyrophosphatase (MazG superfamily)
MATKIYNKLIRDKIPDIIESTGNIAVLETLEPKAYMAALNEKLSEELREYYEDNSVEELADLVEVVYAILKYKAVPIHKFEEIRESKVQSRGAFDKRLFLKEVIEE